MDIIAATKRFVKESLAQADASHDWFHIERVLRLAEKIADKTSCDKTVVRLAALLHDIADAKFHNGDEEIGPATAVAFLKEQNVSADLIDQVEFIIRHISFRNRMSIPKELPIEFQIVQDADRLDALGAIGIARTFHFGGMKNNLIFHPDILPAHKQSHAQYTKSNGTSINHFHEKLLLLKDLMNTDAAKKVAAERHRFMEEFLERFHAEWHGAV